MDGPDLRALIPQVIGVLVRRGADFAAAEDAVQDALVESLRSWPADPPRDPRAWLIAVAWRRFLDATRSESARRRREDLAAWEQAVASSSYSPLLPGDRGDAGDPSGQGDWPDRDDTLWLYFLCAHPALPMPSAIALTLRAVGGLTTRQIARAFLVPEATMAQRISRAKRTLAGQRLDRPGDAATVLRALYLVFNEGYTGEVDLAAEALRHCRLGDEERPRDLPRRHAADRSEGQRVRRRHRQRLVRAHAGEPEGGVSAGPGPLAAGAPRRAPV
ncbi:sigma factor, partial [Dietzia massiliensis]|uniref:sigma factor n=1 Tax=Dietzia massiliensis TaxID=2697499 RepID=UPI001F30221A